jgi:serine/threonine protein kinase/tetratricopeptide (TPR) repeat protein
MLSIDEQPLVPGSKLGRYTLSDRLGAGGNATVFRAKADNGDEVAIKVLHSDLMHEEDLTRFEREYDILQMVDHPRILRVYETGRTGGRHWIAMEFVDGKDISEMAEQWHSEAAADRWEKVERVLRGLAEALAHLHEKGIIHRDLKPTNVLVTKDGEATLMDFGVIKAPDVFSTYLTMAGRLVGTVAFMAPEQITSEGVDHRADLYSLGAVLYVLLTNKRPIVADSIAGYLARQLAQSPRRPALVDASVPPRLDRICTKLLRKSPSERFESAQALLLALEQKEESLPLRLHGRESDQAKLKGLVAAIGSGASGCVGILGPRGSGRTALLDALHDESQNSAVRVLRVGADPLEIQSGLKESESHGPTALLVDDLHTCSARALKELINGFYDFEWPCMVFFSAEASSPNDPSINEGILELLGLPNCTSLWLDPLERTDVISLLRDYGLSPTASALIGRRLHAEFEGLPGAILAQIDALVESGWLSRDPLGSLKTKAGLERFKKEPLPLPQSVREDIQARLNQLLKADRSLMEALVILGGEASTDLLQAVSSFRRGSLDSLVKRNWVFVDTEGLHEIVCVSNPRILQLVLESIGTVDQQALHLKAATGLLARNPRRVTSIAQQVAIHFLAAGESSQAFPLLEQAVQRAARRKDVKKVLALTEIALGNEPEAGAGQAAETQALFSKFRAYRGRALFGEDELESAQILLEEALGSAALSVDTPLVAGARVDLASCFLALGETTKAQKILTPLLKHIEPGSPERLRAMCAASACLRLQGNLNEARISWEEALGVAREQGSKEKEAGCLVGLAKVHLASDQIALAQKALGEAEALFRGTSGLERADCLLQLARLDCYEGRYRRALTRAEEAGELANPKQAMDHSAMGLSICAECLEMVGLDRDAGRLAIEVKGLLRAQGARVSLVSVKSPTAVDLQSVLRQALDHSAAGRGEYGASLLEGALEALPEGFAGLATQLAVALAGLRPIPENQAQARGLVESILQDLSPELAASMRARQDIAQVLGA